MAGRAADTPVVKRVRDLVEPIASDLRLDLYDVEQRGGTMRVTLDTPAGSDAGVDLDQLALATRLISRELDHHDPIPGKYTLEVTSPGVERSLRTPEHFQREIGKELNVRLSDVEGGDRRVRGILVAADATTATLRVGDGADAVERHIDLDSIDRARTVFEWGPQPKPAAKGRKGRQKAGEPAAHPAHERATAAPNASTSSTSPNAASSKSSTSNASKSSTSSTSSTSSNKESS